MLIVKNLIVAALMIVGLSSLRRIASMHIRSLCRIAGLLLVISFIYQEMGAIIHIIDPQWWDSWINDVETIAFGCYPTVWFQPLASHVLTEIMMFAYVMYVPLIPGIAVLCHWKGGQETLERYLTELVLAFFLCYICYFLLPVAGPSRTLQAHFIGTMDGYFFTAITDYMRSHVHLPGGAFPSAHCAASTVVLVALFRNHRRFFYALLPFVVLIYVSTVYGWFHYVSDVLGGILVGFTAIWASPKILDALNHHRFSVAVSWNSVPPADPARECANECDLPTATIRNKERR